MNNMKRLLFILNIILLLSMSLASAASVPAAGMKTVATDPAQALNLVPNPLQVTPGKGSFVLKNGVTIGVDGSALKPAAEYLRGLLEPATGFRIGIVEGTSCDILLQTGKASGTEGSYTLEVGRRQIIIDAHDYSGVISGISTLRQLLPAAIESDQKVSRVRWEIPSVFIEDAPKFGWRGVLLDVSRHFFSKEEVKELLDLMALYKLNRFHWHLTDDQGWRVEIKKYPLLTEKGAWRSLNEQDRICLRRAKAENDPSMGLPAEKLRVEAGDTLYGGYYTQDDIREIVAYAAARGIVVMPEIDMPGHMQTAVSIYDGVACFPRRQLPAGKSSPVCPGKDGAIEFCKDIYEEIFALFPDSHVYIGADEVSKDNWKRCPDCRRRMEEEGLENYDELQSWFVHEIEKFFSLHGKRAIVWDEVMDGGISSETTVLWWNSYKRDIVSRATAQGSPVILCPNYDCYLDYPETPGAMRLIYDMDPLEGLDPGQEKHVLGLQGNIWTEFIPSRERILYMAFPRLLSVAENAWRGEDDWDGFRKRSIGQYERLDILDVNFRMPAIEGVCDRNVFVGETRVQVSSPDPEAVIRYTADGSAPDLSSPLYSAPLKVSEPSHLAFRAFRPDGRAGDTFYAIFEEEMQLMPAVLGTAPSGKGLLAEWHKGRASSCAEAKTLPVYRRYKTSRVEIPDGATTELGLVFTGYCFIPSDGIWSFCLSSASASVLKIDGRELVGDTGPHTRKDESAQCALAKGWHSIEVVNYNVYGGCLSLDVYDPTGASVDLEFAHNENDPMTRTYLSPVRVVWQQDADHISGIGRLLDPGDGQAYWGAYYDYEPMDTGLQGDRAVASEAPAYCRLSSEDGARPAILLDFGKEIHGGVQLVTGAWPSHKPVRIRLRYGESASEAMSEPGGVGGATNDHAIRDQEVILPWLGTYETGNSGFRFVRIDLLDEDATLELKGVRAVSVMRDIPYRGSFMCSDTLLNRIWQTGAYTVHLNMQDYLWDGIKRDRLVWIGDSWPEIMTIGSVFGYNEVVPKSLDLMRDLTPLPNWMNAGFSSYSIWWLLCQYEWYQFTGDFAYLNTSRDYICRLLRQLISKIGPDGREALDGTRFLDWPSNGNPDAIACGLQSLMVWAMRAGVEFAGLFGDEALAAECGDAARRLAEAAPALFENFRRTCQSPDAPGSKQAAALMAVTGLIDPQEADREFISYNGAHGFSTFYGCHMLEAMAAAGNYEGAMDVIRDYWGAMINLGATTFWEDFNLDWTENAARIDELVPEGKKDIHGDCGAYCYIGFRHSLCHGWASGPTFWLSRNVLGVRILEPGCRKVKIEPHLGELDWAEGTFPTPYGEIHVRHEKQPDGSVKTEVKAPEGVTVIK